MHYPSSDVVGDFKAAMRRLASTVAIVTTQNGTTRHGMTATAVTSLTTVPPSLLVCINQSASIHEPIVRTGHFCVNLLACEHEHLVPIFSGKVTGEERFSSGDWATGEFAMPYLENAQANFFCTVSATVAHGSHSVIIGNVDKVVLFGEPSPLLYQEGALYKSIALQ
jgi:flavin reductase